MLSNRFIIWISWAVLAVAMYPFAAQAQAYKLSGTITLNSSPLVGVSVCCQQTGTCVDTNASGYYEFAGLTGNRGQFIAPTKEGYLFNPHDVYGWVGTEDAAYDFTATTYDQPDYGCGRDNNGDGEVDRWCPTKDKDRDGYDADNDCDDYDFYVYPGISVMDGSTVKTCDANGDFQTVSGTLCEKTGSGDCYYINAATGSDSNNGTSPSTPWATYRNLTYAEPSGERPASWVGITAGDAIYFYDGTYDDFWSDVGLSLGSVDGTESTPILVKNYPGENAVLFDGSSANPECINISDSNYVIIEGLNFENCYRAVSQYNGWGNYVQARNNRLQNNGGYVNDNADTIQIGGDYNQIHHNYFAKIGPASGDGHPGNQPHIALYGGADYGRNNRIHHNIINGTLDRNYGVRCIKHKHITSDTTSITEIDHNDIINCRGVAIGMDTPNVNIHHNLVLGRNAVIEQSGDNTYLWGVRVQYNTFGPTLIDTDVAQYAWGFINGDDHSPTPGSSGNVSKAIGNVFLSTAAFNNDQVGFINFGQYYTGARQTDIKNGSQFSNNRYYSPNETDFQGAMFSYDGTNGFDDTTLAAWQARGYDTDSTFAEITFDSYHRAEGDENNGYSEDWEAEGGEEPEAFCWACLPSRGGWRAIIK